MYFPGKISLLLIWRSLKYRMVVSRIFLILLALIKYSLFAPFIWMQQIQLWYLLLPKYFMPPTVIILGHWRSATTNLQRYLSKELGYAYCNNYKVIFPEHYLITETWLKRPLQFIMLKLGVVNEFHNIQFLLDDPGEEEVALTALGELYIPNLFFLYPKYRFELLNRNNSKLWIKKFKNFVRAIHLTSRKRGIVIKSPSNGMFIKEMAEAFPHAKFVLIQREEVATLKSMEKMWGMVNKRFAFQPASQAEIKQYAKEIYGLYQQRLQDDLPTIAERTVKISFDEFIAAPQVASQSIVKKLKEIENANTYGFT